ncbi:MAG: hypothetical protein ABW061_20900 [Polyangiaceae bacterium]
MRLVHFKRLAREWAGLLGAPASRGAYQASAYALTALLLLLAALYTWQQSEPIFPVDDAYIVSHNAEQLLSRAPDARFVGTPPVAGSTSAVHLVLVAAFALVLPVLWAQWCVMILGALAYALAVLRLGYVLGVSILEAWLLLALSLLVAQTPHQLLNGLETSWALAALTLAIAAVRDAHGRRWELPVLCGLMPFLRPELSVVSALLLAQRVHQDFRKQGLHGVAGSLGYAAAAALPWVLLDWASLGTPFPNTIGAKRNFFAEGCRSSARRASALESALFGFQDDVGILYWVVCLLPVTALGRFGVLFGALFAYAYYAAGPGLLRHYEHRYLYLLLPWLIYALGQALTARRAIRALSAGFLVLCLGQAAIQQPERWRWHLGWLDFTRSELQPLARWLDVHARGSKILIHDAGYVGFAVHAPLVDLVGLKTPASLAPHRELTWPQCTKDARGRAIAQIAERAQPQYLVVLEDWDRIFGITDGLRKRHWQLAPRYQGAKYRVFQLSHTEASQFPP